MKRRLTGVFKWIFIVTSIISLGCFFAACGGGKEETAKHTVTVVNGTGSGEYEKGAQVIVTADIGSEEVFVGWTLEGVFVSYDNPYTFKATANITLAAVKRAFSEYDQYTSTLYVEDGEDFVILNLTDFQLHDGKSTYVAFSIIDELVEKVQPDLITVLGDTAEDNGTYATKKNFTAIVEHIDAFGIPWAPIFGNHDCEAYHAIHTSSINDTNDEWIAETFTAAENSVFNVGPEEVSGYGNYIVNVVNRSTEKIVKSLYFFNTGIYGMVNSHVAFYGDAVQYCTALNGGEVPESIVYMHIPLPEYSHLYNSGKYEGIAGEHPGSRGTNEFFTKIKELGSTTHVMCGHDHVNSFYGEYQGVTLMYCLKSSDGDYYNKDQLGGTTFIIGDETTFEYHFVTVTAIEVVAKMDVALTKIDNFKNSGKAFTFEYKARDNAANVGSDIQFTIWGPRWKPRITGLITVDIVNNTASVGTVETLDDGWYRVTINCADIPINTEEGATGSESTRLVYFNVVNHAFLLDNVGFVDCV